MVISYVWPGLIEDCPPINTWVEISGNPDAPVLKGIIANIEENDDGELELAVLMGDGQEGAAELQEWIMVLGDIGLARTDNQQGLPSLG